MNAIANEDLARIVDLVAHALLWDEDADAAWDVYNAVNDLGYHNEVADQLLEAAHRASSKANLLDAAHKILANAELIED